MRAPIDTLRDIVSRQVQSDRPDLTMRQLAVLLHVHQTEAPLGVRELAAHFGLQKSVITRALDRLSTLGMVKRDYEPLDRRRVRVTLQQPGTAYVHAVHESVVAALAQDADQ